MDRLEDEGGGLTEEEQSDDLAEEVQVEPAHAHATRPAVHEATEETAHVPVRAAARDAGEDVSAETLDVLPSSANPNPNLNPNPTLSQRRADALVFLSENWLAGDRGRPGGSDAYLVNVHIDSATLAHAVAGRSELAEGPGLAAETVRRLCCDGGLVTHLTDAAGATIDVGRKTRAIPPAIRRALRHRDRCCRFPGCTRNRWLDGHHVVHWADDGETSLNNLVLLCRHHHRLVHEGGFGAHTAAGGHVRFTTPAGAVIPDAPTGRALELRLEKTLETFQL